MFSYRGLCWRVGKHCSSGFVACICPAVTLMFKRAVKVGGVIENHKIHYLAVFGHMMHFGTAVW